jgi:hypothetical protein
VASGHLCGKKITKNTTLLAYLVAVALVLVLVLGLVRLLVALVSRQLHYLLLDPSFRSLL